MGQGKGSWSFLQVGACKFKELELPSCWCLQIRELVLPSSWCWKMNVIFV